MYLTGQNQNSSKGPYSGGSLEPGTAEESKGTKSKLGKHLLPAKPKLARGALNKGRAHGKGLAGRVSIRKCKTMRGSAIEMRSNIYPLFAPPKRGWTNATGILGEKQSVAGYAQIKPALTKAGCVTQDPRRHIARKILLLEVPNG